MGAILSVVSSFMGQAIIVGAVMGILTRCGNILIRAFSGKEDFL